MSCRYSQYWNWVKHMTEEELRTTHEVQHERHRYHHAKRRGMDMSLWQSQATYNLAVRREMRKRGLL